MAEKLTRKEKIALQKKSPGFSPKEIERKKKSNRSLRLMLGLFVAILGFLLYSNTLNHGFVLDDNGLIEDNTSTKKGVSAIPEIFRTTYRYGMNVTDYQLYRPLSKAMFAAEWSMSPNNPSIHHGFNILFYAILCFMIFMTLAKYMNGNLLVPFLATVLFTAHPLHTEVVANIKSRDEIICLLLSIFATYSFYYYVKNNSTKMLIVGILSYFIALFSKETAITFIAIIPFMYYFFTNATLKKYLVTILPMIFFTGIFLLIRKKVLGDTVTSIPMEDNSLLAIKDFITQRANAIYILGVYMKKLVIPYPLFADGSYNHFPAVGLASWKFLVPFVILIGAGIYAIMRFKKKDVVAFSILYFFATASLISNIIILIGTNYGERLMFVPSLGFCILVAFLLAKVFKQENTDTLATNFSSFYSNFKKPILITSAIILVFSFMTVARNADWEDDYTLYSTDIQKVDDSAHLLFYLANNITSEESIAEKPDSNSRMQLRYQGIDYLTRAIKIYPKYADAYQRRGYIYNEIKDVKAAEEDYRQGLTNNPTHPIIYNNYGTLCFNQNRFEEAKFYFEQAVRYNPKYAHALNNLASSCGVFALSEIDLMKKDPSKSNLHKQRAAEYYSKAIDNFKKSIQADKDFAEPYRLLAITYQNTGNPAEADRYNKLWKEIKNKEKLNAKN